MPPEPAMGIRGAYPRLPLPLRLRAWGAASRPFTLAAPILAVLLAGAAAAAHGAAPRTFYADHTRLLLGILALGFATIGGNLINQAEDTVADLVNRPYRPVPRGLITPARAFAGGVFAWFLALLTASRLSATTELLVATTILLSLSYSVKPLRLKRIPWLGNLGVALARGLIGWCAAWSIWAPLDASAVAMGLVMTIFLIGATTSKDFADAPGDAKENVRTLVVTYGPTEAAWLSLPFILSPLLTLPIVVGVGLVHVDALVALLALLGCLILAWQFVQISQGNLLRANTLLEGSRVWLYHYLCLLLLMATYASTYVAVGM